MRLFIFFAQGLILLSLQTTFFRPMGLSALQCQLWLVPMIYGALQWELKRALILAFMLGYASDVFTGGIQGIGAISALGTTFGAYWTRKGLLLRSAFQLGVLVGPLCVFYQMWALALGYLIEGGSWVEDLGISRILIQSAVLAIVAPLIMGSCQWADVLSQSRFRRKGVE